MCGKMKARQDLPLAIPAAGLIYSMNTKDFYRGLNRLKWQPGQARFNSRWIP
jgi:hypothetical protein